MDIFQIFALLGGLALFLCGMEMMGDALKKLSGSKLETILEKLTSHPLKGVLLGLGVTAVIQSSSATTVMVVGFVNSGIMQLEQAVGVIMGANIGTTVTSWILSLTGIQGESLLLRLLKPSSFSPLLAFIGIILTMFCKSEKKKDTGTILLGFAILMTGMEAMSDAVAPLADVPEFANLMTFFTNPIMGLLAGAILTAIIQSSSASVGILQALCATGAISYSVALPVIMGQNIGTCVTALISAIGANRNSKRAALIHLYFNLIGTTVFMILFYAIHAFVQFPFMTDSANAAGIAVIHSSFNVFATCLLLPFNKILVKLARLTLPDLPESETDSMVQDNPVLALLDERFLEKPAYALTRAKSVSVSITEDVLFMSQTVYPMLGAYEKGDAKQALAMSEDIAEEIKYLHDYLVKISSAPLTEEDNYLVNHLLQSAGYINGITANLVAMAQTAKSLHKGKVPLTETAKKELDELWNSTSVLLQCMTRFYTDEPVFPAQWMSDQQQATQKQIKALKKSHIKRLKDGKCNAKTGMHFLNLLTECEQITFHATTLMSESI